MPTEGNDLIFFEGTLSQLTISLVNPYTGEIIEIDEQKNVNNTTYDGLGGVDTLFMTNFGDALFAENSVGMQVIKNIETILAGNGGDVVALAHDTITLNDMTILGGLGDDIIWGNVGDDEIRGNNGDDIIDGGPGHDRLFGENDNDRISGGDGDDDLHGGAGDDTLIGGLGSNTYFAGLGNDVIIQESSSDLNFIEVEVGLLFGALDFTVIGNDLHVQLRDAGSILIKGQFDSADSGIDRMIFRDGTVFDLRTIEPPPPPEITGTPFDDALEGGDVGEIISGLEGDDVLRGNGGNDVLDGGLGSDLVDGGAGDDLLLYSSDEIWPTGFVAWNVGSPDAIINGDRVVVNPRYRNHDGFDGGEGIDTLRMGDDAEAVFLDDRYSANPFGFNTARLIDIEIIEAGAGNDIVDLTSKQFAYGDVTIKGEEGDDVLWSSSGNDRIEGGIGDDHLDTGTGNDVLIGGAGNDKMYGRGGDDIFVVGENIDRIYTGDGKDVIVYDFLDGATDMLFDFTTGLGGDVLNITDILQGYDPLSNVISDFVQLVNNGGDTEVHVNADGDVGGDFTVMAVIDGGISDTLVDLINNGNLVADQSVVV